MNKLALIAVSAALAITAASQSRIAEAATLRTETTISGDTVHLGDLFDDVMGKEDQPVGRAPAPGRRATYDAAYLIRIASYHQISWRPGSQFDTGGRDPHQFGRERRHGPQRRRGRAGGQGGCRPAGRRSRQQASGSASAGRSADHAEAGIHDLRSGPGPVLRRPGRSGRRAGTDPHRHLRPGGGPGRCAGPDPAREARRSDHRIRHRLHGSPHQPHGRRSAARHHRPDRPDPAPPDHREHSHSHPRPSAAAGRHQGIAGHHGSPAEIHDADRPGQGLGSRQRRSGDPGRQHHEQPDGRSGRHRPEPGIRLQTRRHRPSTERHQSCGISLAKASLRPASQGISP